MLFQSLRRRAHECVGEIGEIVKIWYAELAQAPGGSSLCQHGTFSTSSGPVAVLWGRSSVVDTVCGHKGAKEMEPEAAEEMDGAQCKQPILSVVLVEKMDPRPASMEWYGLGAPDMHKYLLSLISS